MTRNHSQVISCDIPADYEYDSVVLGSARKRMNKTNQNGEKSKKAKLSPEGEDSEETVFYSANNSTNISKEEEEEIEILGETPAKTLEERTKGMLQLKKKAQSFIRASQVAASTSQSKIDEWGSSLPGILSTRICLPMSQTSSL